MSAGSFREIRFNDSNEFKAFHDLWCNPHADEKDLRLFDAQKGRLSKGALANSLLSRASRQEIAPASTRKQIEGLRQKYFDNLTGEDLAACNGNMDRIFDVKFGENEMFDINGITQPRMLMKATLSGLTAAQIETAPTACQIEHTSSTVNATYNYQDPPAGCEGTTLAEIEGYIGNTPLDGTYITPGGSIAYVYDNSGHGYPANHTKLYQLLPQFNARLDQLEEDFSIEKLRGCIKEFSDQLSGQSLDGALALVVVRQFHGQEYAFIFECGDSQGLIYDENNELIFASNRQDQHIQDGKITRYRTLGMHMITLVELRKGDKIVLVTDGYTEYVRPNQLLEGLPVDSSLNSDMISKSVNMRLMGSETAPAIYLGTAKNQKHMVDPNAQGIGPEAGVLGEKQWKACHMDNHDDTACAVIHIKAVPEAEEKTVQATESQSKVERAKNKISLFFNH